MNVKEKVWGKLILWGAVLFLLATLILISKLVEHLDADRIMVIQAPFTGELTWYTTPGAKWQGFGSVTKYPRRAIYNFETQVRFNDGGHGTMKGSIQYEMPLNIENLTELHIKFGSPTAIQKQLIETVTNKSAYMTGPLMSSKESYAEKRNDLIRYVEDQVIHGVYRTTSKEAKIKDQITGTDKTVTIVEIVTKNGVPERQEEPVLTIFGIRPFNFTITSLPYDETVEAQIKQQQVIAMDVQTAIADAKKAEQRTITVSEQGKANAAEAKWKQEGLKATEVTLAQQKLEVATLEAKAAEQVKNRDILLGEGQAAAKELIIKADGALEKKLDALIKINDRYATAIENYSGNWVPAIVMGDNKGSGVAGSGAIELIELLTAKTAHDLAINLELPGLEETKKQAKPGK